MSENQGTGGNAMDQQLQQGTSVFDAGGQTVGVVKEYNPQGGYLVVKQGWAFSQDAYIPLDLIGDTGASGIYLKLDKDALVQQNWNRPPTRGAAVGTGAAGSTAGGTTHTTMVPGQATDIGPKDSAATEERPEEIEQTRAPLSETIDARQERLSPEHVVEQAQETVQGTTKHGVGQAREMIRKAAAGKVQPMVSSARDTAQKVAGSARDTAQKVAGSAGDMAQKVVSSARDRAKGGESIMTDAPQTVDQNGQKRPAGTSLFTGGLTGWSLGMGTGLVLGLIAGLFLGLLINNTARSYAMARAELPKTVAPRPWWIAWRRT